jgi:hypothetical protein
MWQLSPRPEQLIFLDRANNSLFALAAQGHGLLLTGGDLHLIQLRPLARFLSGTPGCSVRASEQGQARARRRQGP